MILIKGNKGKSRIVDIIGRSENSFTYMYYTEQIPLTEKYFFLNSKTYSLQDLRKVIIKQNESGDSKCYYMIIYTNLNEDDLSGFIGWINQNEKNLNCTQVIVTCR